MLTRLKTEMLVRQESIINQVSQRGVPSNSLAMRKADGGGGGDDVRYVDVDGDDAGDGVGEAGAYIGGGDEIIADFKHDECSYSPFLAGHL